MITPQRFYTYGDTDEPSVEAQTEPLWEAIWDLRRQTQRLDAYMDGVNAPITAAFQRLLLATSYLTTDPPSVAAAFEQVERAIEALAPLANR